MLKIEVFVWFTVNWKEKKVYVKNEQHKTNLDWIKYLKFVKNNEIDRNLVFVLIVLTGVWEMAYYSC